MISNARKLSARVVALILCAATSSASFAQASQWCQGTISHAWVDHAGYLLVLPSWRGDHLRLCSLRTTLSDAHIAGIDAATCKSWVVMTLQAVASNKQMIMYYPWAPACNSIPYYHQAPLPGYVMIAN
jgi:hypothetical protein